MFLFGVAKYLFSALSLAVVLSMLASYVVAMTVIPIYCARFLTVEEARAEEQGTGHGRLGWFIRGYERFAGRYERLLERALDHKLRGDRRRDGALRRRHARRAADRHGALPAHRRRPVHHQPARAARLAHRGDRGAHRAGRAGRSATSSRRTTSPWSCRTSGSRPGFSAIYSSNAASDSGFVMVSLKPDHERLDLGVHASRSAEALRHAGAAGADVLPVGQHHRRGAELRAGGADRRPAERAGLRRRCTPRRRQVARHGAPGARGGRRLRPAGVRLSDAPGAGRPGEGRAARPLASATW